MDDDIPYLLLTPGPLTTSRTVRRAMLRDYCTWDDEYNSLVSSIRRRLTALATPADGYTTTLMQGSGTFVVESVVGSTIPADGKLLVVDNGAYGRRIASIAERLGVERVVLNVDETQTAPLQEIETAFRRDATITHLAMVHCETTTGLLNPAAEVGRICQEFGKTYILDAMSSFGGVPLDMAEWNVDYLISSANKCIQGAPGFGFAVARRDPLAACEGRARSLSLDLYDQWREMEEKNGKWRYTSPTHVVRAFDQAMIELVDEGGVAARHQRYCENQRRLREGMVDMGFDCLIDAADQSPIITAFYEPVDERFTFARFYDELKARRFVIYPGKVSLAATFRIGTIGHVFPADVDELLAAIAAALSDMNLSLGR
ncbi:MAG: 2-aminoethylphosphonate--pyruvate transaminase [Pirellulaceae bacterium]|jgi:2-aminoethylphosphonate-pyruvate transaminase|nr:2-aminoethylphosphonate--pyruvate transaminase [Pirellulaceae bacterium]MDP7016444.1 2-aminoethylphosphonate--pyruvate transaminase [Pirellulaceae bacterium]